MKICHILWGLKYGGIETMVSNIANEQASNGNEVYLIVINDLIDPSMMKNLSPSVNTLFIGRKKGSRNILDLIRLNFKLIQLSPDIVHFHHPRQRKLIFPKVVRKTCTTIHIDCLPYLIPLVKNTPNLFAISKHVHDDVLKKTGKDSIVVVNGIKPSLFKKKTEYYDGSRPFRILQLGRIDFSHKGQDIFIKAFNELRAKGINIHGDIIGTGESETELKELVNSLNLGNYINILGNRNQAFLFEHLSDYDLIVHPSRHEGFGLVIAEAMAAKVPVLVSDIDVQLEIIDRGKYGYYFKNGDFKDMANAIKNIISNYDISFLEKSLERVNTLYNVKATSLRYLNEYSRILEG